MPLEQIDVVKMPRRHWPWAATATWLAAMVILVTAGWAGVRFQHWMWDASEPIRFTGDINNNYNQGARAQREGLLLVYDKVAAAAKTRPDGVQEYGLDYPPLRLTMAWWWQGWTVEQFPEAGKWQNTRAFHEPLLRMNRFVLMAGAVGAFAVVWLVRRRSAGETAAAGTGAIAGACAAAMVWLSLPATLIGFGWPQWDVIVPAAYLLALGLALGNRWLLAGAVVAVGAMYKGQALLALPVLMLWPLAGGMPGALGRFVIGFALAAGLIAAPFMYHTPDGVLDERLAWLAGAMLVPWGVGVAMKLRRLAWYWWLLPGAIAVVTPMLGAMWIGGAGVVLVIGVAGAVTLLLGARLPWRYQAAAGALGVACGIWSVVLAPGHSLEWLNVGFVYGTGRYSAMVMGAPSNLPAILASGFGISRPDTVALTLPAWVNVWGEGDWDITWRTLLRFVFVTGSIACGIAAGMHYRRRSVLFVVAACAPIMLFVTFPAQIHERYVTYAGVTSAILLAAGLRWWTMHLTLIVLAALPVLQGMLRAGNPRALLVEEMGADFGVTLLRNVQATFPGLGWALIVLTLVCVYGALRTSATPRVPRLPR